MLVNVKDIKFKYANRSRSGLYSKLKEVISSLEPGQAFVFTPDKYPESFRHLKPMAYQIGRRIHRKVSVREHELGFVILVTGST